LTFGAKALPISIFHSRSARVRACDSFAVEVALCFAKANGSAQSAAR
jgi:hypothetical protein